MMVNGLHRKTDSPIIIMKKRYLLEAALRPIVEFQSATLALLTAALVWLFQYYLLMPPMISGLTVLVLVLYAMWRLRDAMQLRYYQRHLTVLPLTCQRMPTSCRPQASKKELLYAALFFACDLPAGLLSWRV